MSSHRCHTPSLDIILVVVFHVVPIAGLAAGPCLLLAADTAVSVTGDITRILEAFPAVDGGTAQIRVAGTGARVACGLGGLCREGHVAHRKDEAKNGNRQNG